MTDADWRRVERDMEKPEDRAAREAAEEKAQRKARGPQVDMDALNSAKTQEERNKILSAAAAAHSTPGKGMTLGYVFVTVRFEGCCPSDRKEVTQLGRKWSSLLASTGMDAAASISKDDQLSFETKHENHVREITDFMMLQPEVAVVRHDLANTYGPAATPEFVEEWERTIAEREAAKEEKIRQNREQAARRKRREEKAAKKREKKERKKERKERRQREQADGEHTPDGETHLPPRGAQAAEAAAEQKGEL